MLTLTEEHSIINGDGTVLFYSADHFLRDIVDGNHCFICGAKPGSVAFNDEHVIPDWILRRYGLHAQKITLPGGSELAYGQYKVPCCETCNSNLGKVFEEPISELFSKGYSAIVTELTERNPLRLFAWMNLIFLKTHLKDRTLLVNRDRRVQSPRISELYDWPELHHIHCVSRMFHTGVSYSPTALGSLFIWPAKTGSELGDFDYGDYYPGRAMFLRLGEVFILCVLNDANAALCSLDWLIHDIAGPLSPVQCRELLARFADANIRLKNRPQFYTEVGKAGDGLLISANVPKHIEQEPFVAPRFGEVLYSALGSLVTAIPFPEPETAREHIRQGRWTFLFDSDGKFLR